MLCCLLCVWWLCGCPSSTYGVRVCGSVVMARSGVPFVWVFPRRGGPFAAGSMAPTPALRGALMGAPGTPAAPQVVCVLTLPLAPPCSPFFIPQTFSSNSSYPPSRTTVSSALPLLSPILPGRQILAPARSVQEALRPAHDAASSPGDVKNKTKTARTRTSVLSAPSPHLKRRASGQNIYL